MKLFITGATGFLGSELIPKLAGDCDHLYLLTRKNSLEKAKEKFADYCNISYIIGDLTNPDLIEGEFDDLLDEVDTILHMGAYYDLEGTHKACFQQNIQGTLNLLFFAGLCKNLKALHYISTVAVSGTFEGEFLEDNFFHKEEFTNEYSKTKWEAERLVRVWKGKAKVRIYRPGIIIGNSETGKFDKVDGPYYFWKTLSNMKLIAPIISKLPFLPMPIDKNATLPIISVDNAARLIRNGIFLENDLDLMTFHLVEHSCPNVFDLIKESLEEFAISAEIKVIKTHPLIDKTFKTLGLPKEIIHYMIIPVDYSVKNSLMFLGLNDQRGFENYKSIIFKKAKEVFGAKK